MLKKIQLNLTTIKDVIVRRNFELIQEVLDQVYRNSLTDTEEEAPDQQHAEEDADLFVEIWENRAGSVIGLTNTLVPFGTSINSTRKAWLNNSRFSASEEGYYHVDLVLQAASGFSLPMDIYLYKNGTSGTLVMNLTHMLPSTATRVASYGDRHGYRGSTVVYLLAGEHLEVWANSPLGGIALVTGAGGNRIAITKL